jgi:hypothetical protein
LEIVWHASPRLLENVHNPTFPHSYLRASRDVGKLAYQVDYLYVPTSPIVSTEIPIIDHINDFQWLAKKLKQHSERIAELESVLGKAGAREISLEFKVDDGHFQFIDWDTGIEMTGNKVAR